MSGVFSILGTINFATTGISYKISYSFWLGVTQIICLTYLGSQLPVDPFDWLSRLCLFIIFAILINWDIVWIKIVVFVKYFKFRVPRSVLDAYQQKLTYFKNESDFFSILSANEYSLLMENRYYREYKGTFFKPIFHNHLNNLKFSPNDAESLQYDILKHRMLYISSQVSSVHESCVKFKIKFLLEYLDSIGVDESTLLVFLKYNKLSDITCLNVLNNVGSNLNNVGSNLDIAKTKHHICKLDNHFINFLKNITDFSIFLNYCFDSGVLDYESGRLIVSKDKLLHINKFKNHSHTVRTLLDSIISEDGCIYYNDISSLPKFIELVKSIEYDYNLLTGNFLNFFKDEITSATS